MVADGRVAALWGGGIGWPGFTAIGKALADTFVRGHQVMTDGVVSTEPVGRYLSRPTTA